MGFGARTIAMQRREAAIRREKEQMAEVSKALQTALAPLITQGKVRITQSSRGINVEFNASVLFATGEAKLTNDSMQSLRQVAQILNGVALAYRGIAARAHVYTAREAELAAMMPAKAAADMSKFLLCPMPGLVKAVHVAEGAQVKAGDALAVVEAMKMENVLRAERDARVKTVKAKPGESLAVDAVILEFA